VSRALRVANLAKRYGDLQALEDVSFDVEAGELIAILGPNGAGKTTLLSIIAGSLTPSSGTVDRKPSEIGWAPQQPAVYSKLSVAENLELFARLERVADPGAAVERMLEQTGLADRADEAVARLSGGNRQRVNVAIALLADPPVLALDEPSAALDPAQRERLWDFISSVRANGTAVLLSTHNASEAQRHAQRLLVLADGRLLFDGTPDGLLEQAGAAASGDLERGLLAFLAAREARSEGGVS
jgi:ABC-2 type transport system ATP-binding protein